MFKLERARTLALVCVARAFYTRGVCRFLSVSAAFRCLFMRVYCDRVLMCDFQLLGAAPGPIRIDQRNGLGVQLVPIQPEREFTPGVSRRDLSRSLRGLYTPRQRRWVVLVRLRPPGSVWSAATSRTHSRCYKPRGPDTAL